MPKMHIVEREGRYIIQSEPLTDSELECLKEVAGKTVALRIIDTIT